MTISVPTSYTDETLRDYLHEQLGPMADVLKWTVDQDDYDSCIVDALRGMGETSVAEVAEADVPELLARSTVALWTKVVRHTASFHDSKGKSANVALSQIHGQALQERDIAMGDLAVYDTTYGVIAVNRLTFTDDPYASLELDDEEDA